MKNYQKSKRRGKSNSNPKGSVKRIRVSSKGRITLPVEVRQHLSIKEGTILQLSVIHDKIELAKLPQLGGQPLLRDFKWDDYQPLFEEDYIQPSFAAAVRRILSSPKRPSLNFRVFLDSTVLITASIFENGSSRLFLEICQAALTSTLVTRLILQEAEENIQRLPFPQAYDQYRGLIRDLALEIIPVSFPRLQAIDISDDTFGVKDSHVIAGVEAGRSTHLITLDRSGFLQDQHQRALFPIIACTPYQFMKDYLVNV